MFLFILRNIPTCVAVFTVLSPAPATNTCSGDFLLIQVIKFVTGASPGSVAVLAGQCKVIRQQEEATDPVLLLPCLRHPVHIPSSSCRVCWLQRVRLQLPGVQTLQLGSRDRGRMHSLESMSR